MAGCYCEPASRKHKWGLVLETIHFALAAIDAQLIWRKKINQEARKPGTDQFNEYVSLTAVLLVSLSLQCDELQRLKLLPSL